MANKGKRWIKLHRSIADWEFFDYPGMLEMWVRLLIMADEEGNIMTSESELARQCNTTRQRVRTMLEKLSLTDSLTKLATKSPTKLATKLTISKWALYQGSPTSNQPSNQPSEQPSTASIPISSFLNEKRKHSSISFTDVQDIERETEKRNKEKPPKGGKKKKENDSTDSAAPLVRSEEFEKFEDWIERHAPAVAKMEKPFTEEQYREISKNWDARDVRDVLEAMGNTKRLLKDYVSAYATCKNWLKRRQENNNKKNHRNSNLFVNDEWDEQ